MMEPTLEAIADLFESYGEADKRRLQINAICRRVDRAEQVASGLPAARGCVALRESAFACLSRTMDEIHAEIRL